MKLKTTMKRQGIEVTCVLPSKSVPIFDAQLGAAFYRTTVGNIDVMFLRPSMGFEIHVVERKQDGRYLFSFEGKPPCGRSGLRCKPSMLFHTIRQRYVYSG